MSLFGIAFAILFLVVAAGAFRIYECLARFICEILPGLPARKISFSTVSVMVAAMLAPFLIPSSLTLQISVWALYLGFFAIGAWRIYEIACVVVKDLHQIDKLKS